MDDEIDGLAKLLMASDTEEIHHPVNIGNPHELTVYQIAEKVIKLTGSQSKIVFEPLPEDDPKVRRPAIARATELLGWKPEISLEEGLSRTIDYFRSTMNDKQ